MDQQFYSDVLKILVMMIALYMHTNTYSTWRSLKDAIIHVFTNLKYRNSFQPSNKIKSILTRNCYYLLQLRNNRSV
jgi:hypothetical protein